MGQWPMTVHSMEFADRLSRIEAGVGSAKTTLYVGLDEAYTVKYRPRGNGVLDTRRSTGVFIRSLSGFLVGVTANAAARWVDYFLTGLPDASKSVDVTLTMEFVIALMLSAIIGMFLGIGLRKLLVARLLGIAAGILGLHNLVHAYPAPFEMAYSTEWVESVQSTTEAHSILWRGVSITF
jgi:hypothetical protein